MALIKTPDGGWFVDDNEFIVDYQENSVKLKNSGAAVEAGKRFLSLPKRTKGKF